MEQTENIKRKALLIFVRNAEYGQVKNRLAKTVGHTNALRIYRHLLNHTGQVALECKVERFVLYSNFIETDDVFDNKFFSKMLQHGENLGEKMYQAAKHTFEAGFNQVVIIGSDCYDLTGAIIKKAFKALETNQIVIGPAFDGGYYLLGMNNIHEEFFINKAWGSENVFIDTLLDIKAKNLSYFLLPTLNDVDVEEDLGKLKDLIKNKRNE